MIPAIAHVIDYVTATLRPSKSPAVLRRLELQRRMREAAQSFPNNNGGYYRRPPVAAVAVSHTPEDRRQLLAEAFARGPQPNFTPRKPSRTIHRRQIVGVRVNGKKIPFAQPIKPGRLSRLAVA